MTSRDLRSCRVSSQPTFLVSRISRIVRCWVILHCVLRVVTAKSQGCSLWVFAGSLHTFHINKAAVGRIFPDHQVSDQNDIWVRLCCQNFSYLTEVRKKSINKQLVIWLGEWQNSCNKLITIELSWSYLDPVKILFCTLIVCANCAALQLHSIKSSTLLLLSGWQEFGRKLQYHAFTF